MRRATRAGPMGAPWVYYINMYIGYCLLRVLHIYIYVYWLLAIAYYLFIYMYIYCLLLMHNTQKGALINTLLLILIPF